MSDEITKTLAKNLKNEKIMKAFKDQHDIDFVKLY